MCCRRRVWFRYFMPATLSSPRLLWQSWNPLLQELDCVMVWEKFVDVLSVLSSHIIIQTFVFHYIYLSIPMLYYSPYHLLDIFFLATINYISISSVSARFSSLLLSAELGSKTVAKTESRPSSPLRSLPPLPLEYSIHLHPM